MIGDPSGRSTERVLLNEGTVHENVSSIGHTLRSCLSRQNSEFRLVNNMDWYQGMGMIYFLRDVGKHFRVNQMLQKDSVKGRLETHQGISFTEFSYMLLQSYDFLRLNEEYGCNLQVGGSDQWGNITAGIDLVQRVRNQQAFGMTLPLLTTSTGEKLGKSSGIGETVWLSEKKTSVYDFYQFFMRIEDASVGKYLRLFTLLPLEQIEEIQAEHSKSPEKRLAQRALAESVTKFVHGEEASLKAEAATKALFQNNLPDLSWGELEGMLKEAPKVELTRDQFVGRKLIDLALQSNMAPTKGLSFIVTSDQEGDIKRLVETGGLYLNNVAIKDKQYAMRPEDIRDNKFCLLRTGKTNYRVIMMLDA